MATNTEGINVIYTVSDFEDVLLLRNQLINCDWKQLTDFYQNMDNYLSFLHTAKVLSEVDSAFLLLRDDFIDKMERIMGIHRFDVGRGEAWDTANELVTYFNGVKQYSEPLKNSLKNGYLAYQEDSRKTPFGNEEEFLFSLGYDAVVLCAMKNRDITSLTEDDMFLASINYFIECFPEVFAGEEVKSMVLYWMDHIETKGWPFRKELREFSRETKEAFQKIKND